MKTNETLELVQRLKEALSKTDRMTTVLQNGTSPSSLADRLTARHLLDQAIDALYLDVQRRLGHCPHALAKMEDFLDAPTMDSIRFTVAEDLDTLPTEYGCGQDEVPQIELNKAAASMETADYLLVRVNQLLGFPDAV